MSFMPISFYGMLKEGLKAMKKGIKTLAFVLFFSAHANADDKMICYVPKK